MMKYFEKCLTLALVTVCVCAGSANAAQWTGAVDQDWNNPGNWDAAPGGVNDFINVAVGNYPIVSAAPTFTPVDIFVGSGAAGRLDQLTGTLGTGNGNWMFVGQAPGNSNGTYNLANTAGTGGTFTGFAQGDGSLNVGGASQNGVLHVGIDGATAVINVNTSGTIAASQITTGSTNHANNSTFNIDNGTITVSTFRIGGDFGWGTNVASNNNFNMSGGSITATTGELWLGGIGVGTSTMTGGTINSGAWLAVGRNRPGTNTTFNMTGGTINAAQTSGWLVVGGFDQGKGTINASSGVINSLREGIWIGEGATGTANFSGNVEVNGGWLYIGGNDGSVGDVNITGSSVDVDATNLYLGLNGAGADTTAMGTLNFIADAAGISTISLIGDVNLSSPDGDFLGVDLAAYTGPFVDMLLIDGLTSQGEFTGLAQGAAVSTNSALAYTIDYSVAGDVWLRAIPEPASLMLVLGCLGCLATTRSRK
jgi:hypothetical protein